MSLVIPPIASLAFRGTARELTWYSLMELTPIAAGIAYNSEAEEGNIHKNKS